MEFVKYFYSIGTQFFWHMKIWLDEMRMTMKWRGGNSTRPLITMCTNSHTFPDWITIVHMSVKAEGVDISFYHLA